jgi:hypothetical protein
MNIKNWSENKIHVNKIKGKIINITYMLCYVEIYVSVCLQDGKKPYVIVNFERRRSFDI